MPVALLPHGYDDPRLFLCVHPPDRREGVRRGARPAVLPRAAARAREQGAPGEALQMRAAREPRGLEGGRGRVLWRGRCGAAVLHGGGRACVAITRDDVGFEVARGAVRGYVHAMQAIKIMLVRHAEKPGIYGGKLCEGVRSSGEQDEDSLIVRGWQRA